MPPNSEVKETDHAPRRRRAARRSVGWMGLKRGHQAHPIEWLAEKAIFLISLTAIVMVFLIFAFVGREALPLVMGQMSTAKATSARPVSDLDTMKPAEIQAYLELTPGQYASMDKETLTTLMELKVDALKEASNDKDASLNTISGKYLFLPHQWTDYPQPAYIWQPVSQVPKYNLMPLIVGSIKATLVALLFSVPLALGAAIYVSQLCPPKWKEYLKPALEMLAGIPSVVLGFFALLLLATWLQKLFGYEGRLNALVAGIALGLAIIPLVFSIAEDALTSVPRSYTQAALALGASRWQAAWQVVLPAALPGVFAAVVLGFGRAIGETMVVLMASGNASIMSWNVLDSTRTMTATIAAEMAEVVHGGVHYRMLFLIGAMLFLVTLISNFAGDLVVHRLKRRLEGKN